MNTMGVGRRMVIGVLALGSVAWTAGAWAAPAGPPLQPAVVAFREGRLTVRAEGIPLGVVLAALARETRLVVTVNGSPADEPVSVTLTEVDLESGIRRLLLGRSYLLVSAEEPAQPGHPQSGRLLEVVVLSRVSALATATGPDGDRSGLHGGRARNRRDRAADETDRVRVLRLASQREGEQALPMLAAALGDPDESVRRTALDAIKDIAERVPVDEVARMSRLDASPRLRTRALELLAERAKDEAGDPLRLALNDPDPEVSERAGELLDDLGLGNGPDAGGARGKARGGRRGATPAGH